MRLSGWWGLDRRLALETFEQVLLLTNKAPEELKELEILTESAMETTDSFPPRLVFRELIWPYARRMRSFYNSESSRRLALIVIAIERHRLTNSGELPEDLDQLKQFGLSPVPLDPYDGNPLRYVSKTNGYWVYSVHADRTDDQGEVYRIGDERDYSLRVEWPAE